MIEALARTGDSAHDTVVARSLSTGAAVVSALSTFKWDRLRPLFAAEASDAAAAAALASLRTALGRDEAVTGLTQALATSEEAAFSWLDRRLPLVDDMPTPQPQGPQGPGDVAIPLPPRGPRGPAAGQARRGRGERAEPILDSLRGFLAAHADEHVTVEWRVDG